MIISFACEFVQYIFFSAIRLFQFFTVSVKFLSKLSRSIHPSFLCFSYFQFKIDEQVQIFINLWGCIILTFVSMIFFVEINKFIGIGVFPIYREKNKRWICFLNVLSCCIN